MTPKTSNYPSELYWPLFVLCHSIFNICLAGNFMVYFLVSHRIRDVSFISLSTKKGGNLSKTMILVFVVQGWLRTVSLWPSEMPVFLAQYVTSLPFLGMTAGYSERGRGFPFGRERNGMCAFKAWCLPSVGVDNATMLHCPTNLIFCV